MQEYQYQTQKSDVLTEADFTDGDAEPRIPGVSYSPDGSIRWEYDLEEAENPVIRNTIFFVMHVVLLPIMLFAAGMMIKTGFDLSVFRLLLGLYGMIMLICLASIKFVSYLSGGHSYLQYEMNEAGIVYYQSGSHKEYEDSGNVHEAQEHTLKELEDSLYRASSAHGNTAFSCFKNVRHIRRDRRHNLIWVNSGLLFNMVFVPDEAYDAVFEYIAARCPNARIDMK